MTKPSTYNACVPLDALTSLDRINSVIVEGTSLGNMLDRVLDEILDIFDCQRAWILHPCDPDAGEIHLLAERCRPGFEGALAREGKFPPDGASHAFISKCLKGVGPIRFDPLNDPGVARSKQVTDRFNVQSQMLIALRPLDDRAWILGFHHCKEPLVYDQAEPLFSAIGRRVGDGLTTHLTMNELRESGRRYQALVDHATEAIMILDIDNLRCLEANPATARMYGYPRHELIGPFRPGGYSPEFQPDGTPSAVLSKGYFEQAVAGENPVFEWTYERADGSLGSAHVSMTRFPDPTRNLVRITLVDVSDLKQAEQIRTDLEIQLTQAQKLETIGQMSGGVAHDFNNLLSVILGNLELLQDEIDDADKNGLIDAAIKATFRGADLTRKMLSFARRAHLEPRVMELSEVLQETDNWMHRTLPANISVQESLPDGLWPIEADHASTESAILNLIINARDAMPEGGVLTIEAANHIVGDDVETPGRGPLAPGRYVMLAVSDTGFGIPAVQLDKVFEPFFTTKRTGEGSGLGLSMVHGFMKQSGGAVRIYSEPASGTTVKLFFRTPETAAAEPDEAPQKILPQTVRSARVLFAEDEADVASILTRILRSAGYHVVVAETGDAAAELFTREGPFDLLVTDIVMPGGLQGPGLARALREVQPSLPVVFMSGYAREAALHGNGLRESDIRLMKPVARRDLLAAVHQALSET